MAKFVITIEDAEGGLAATSVVVDGVAGDDLSDEYIDGLNDRILSGDATAAEYLGVGALHILALAPDVSGEDTVEFEPVAEAA